MKKIIMFLSAIALFVACDKEETIIVEETNVFYALSTGGTTGTISNVSAAYYAGDNTLVVYNFAYSAVMQAVMSENLVLSNLTLDTSYYDTDDYFTLSGDKIAPTGSALVVGNTKVDNLSVVVIDKSKAEFSFDIDDVGSYGQSGTTDYTFHYIGNITYYEGSYSQQ